MEPKYHRLSLQQSADGKVMVAVDILGPITNPLEGMSIADKMRVLIRPYSRSERALVRAVKVLPGIAKRAVVADILAARRSQLEHARQKRAERDLVDAWIKETIEKGQRLVRLQQPITNVPGIAPIVDVTPADIEPSM